LTISEHKLIGPEKLTERQVEFMQSPASDILFGGSAGGAKTIALFWAAVAYCWRYPGVNAVVFRRHYTELVEKIIPLARDLDESIGTWREGAPYAFTFNNACKNGCVHGLPVRSHGGSVLKFRHAEHETDVLQYKGADFHFVGFDELTSFEEFQIRYILGRCMRGPEYYPLVLRSTTNPDGASMEYVKERYIEPDLKIVRKLGLQTHTHSEGRWEYECPYSHKIWQPYEEGLPIMPRQFIPSSWRDNIFIDRERYEAELGQLPEPIRSAQRDGSWDLFVSMAFPEFSKVKHVWDWDSNEDVLETFPDLPKTVGVDYGYSPDPWAAVFAAHDYNIRHPRDRSLHRVYIYDEFCENYILAADQAMKIYEKGPFRAVIGGGDMGWKRGVTKVEINPESIYRSYGLPFRVFPLATRTRMHRKSRLHDFLQTAPDGKPYLIIHPRCKQLIGEIPKLVTDPNDENDIKHTSGTRDNLYDALTYLLTSSVNTAQERPRFLRVKMRV